MEIIVSSPGSPGTSFTDNVKEQIILLSDELEKNKDFANLPAFKNHLKACGLNANYVRNILPFLQYCGLVKYEGIRIFDNKYCHYREQKQNNKIIHTLQPQHIAYHNHIFILC